MPNQNPYVKLPETATISYLDETEKNNEVSEQQKIEGSYQIEYEAEVNQGPQYGPGKKNFSQLYRRIKAKLGNKPTCKISGYSDFFNPNKNYAGMVVYAIDNKFSWTSNSGLTKGYKGRAFYFVIQCTDDWPDDILRDVGNGRVHHYLIKNTLGIEFDQDVVCCGGFSYHNRELKFSSVWLNQRDQKGCKTDNSKYLNEAEERLVRYCFNQYKRKGPDSIFEIPDWLDDELWG